MYQKYTGTAAAHFYVIGEALKIVENKVRRDFGELMNLQNSRNCLAFASATVGYLNDKFYDFFTEKRSGYSLVLEGYNKNWEGGDGTFYVDALCGFDNFLHAISYFATVVVLRKGSEIIGGLLNNYSAGETFYASRGGGAFLNGKRIRTPQRTMGEGALIAMGCDSKGKIPESLLAEFSNPRVSGCYPLDICYTACGRYDATVVFAAAGEKLEFGKLFMVEAGGLYGDRNGDRNGGENGVVFASSALVDSIKGV
ncbi:MAG: hypothetical protein LBI70_00280 [Rickettsiales bacterium]|nr:hypothetical protein [Rickettsiales bacterium]